MMERVPEEMLRNVLERLVSVTSGSESKKHRQTAVRWFNRLYYDVRKWNKGFIRFMKAHQRGDPGAGEEYEEYVASLANPHGEVKNELCRNLVTLTERFHKDFAWLCKEDEPAYQNLDGLLKSSYRSEYKIIYCAHKVTKGQMELCEYEQTASRMITELNEYARQVGVLLLDISEYEEILRKRVSADSRVILIDVGGIDMSGGDMFKDIIGPVVSKSKLTGVAMIVGASTALPSNEREDLVRLLSELDAALEPVRKAKPDGACRVERQAETVAEEVAGGNSDRSFLDFTVQGLKQAAEAVKDIAPAVLEVAGRIVSFIAGLAVP